MAQHRTYPPPKKRKPKPLLVRIRNLSFTYGARAILKNVSLDVPQNKIIAIMGPSGTGKTTLLQLISGQRVPESGTIEVMGESVPNLKRGELNQLRQEMGMLFQNGALLTDLDVFENVAFPLREYTKLPESMIHDLVLRKLELVGLRGARRLMPAQLSGGMARRVALARAIVRDPQLILYDEPFSGQDPVSKNVLMDLIYKLNRTLGITSIIVSHDVEETMTIADYVYLIADQNIVARGTPAELATNQDAWVRQFLDGKTDGPVTFHYPAKPLLEELCSA